MPPKAKHVSMLKEIIIQVLPPFIAGGGLMYLFNFRLNLQRSKSKIEEDEFNSLSGVIDRSVKQIGELSERVAQVEEQKSELHSRLQEAIQENHSLKARLSRCTCNV
jgi:hypothetical protein